MITETIPAELRDFTVSQLNTPTVMKNPYPYYDYLRSQPAQFGLKDYPPGTVPGQDTPIPAWVFLTHKDVCAISRDAARFSSRDIMQEESEAPSLMLVNHDAPRHTELRKIAQAAFTPKRIEADVMPWMKAMVQDQLDQLGSGEVDVMQDLAPNVPALVMTKLIGTPASDYVLLRRWANAFMVTSDFTIEERNTCNLEVYNYYRDAVDQRYRDIDAGLDVPDDLMTSFIRTEVDESKLTKEEVTLFCITLVVAGAETTGYLIGNLIHSLASEPGMFDLLKENRDNIRPFINESLRRDGPVQRLHRVCVEDTMVGDVMVKAGDWVAVFFASANRDPAVWEKPNEFILHRKNIGKQMTFGHGIHHCMGSAIARNEAYHVLDGLLDRYESIELASTPAVRQSGGLLNYGFERCPVMLNVEL